MTAVPWERIHEPVERLNLELIDLADLGFEIMASGLLIDAPDWYQQPVNEINALIGEACRHV